LYQMLATTEPQNQLHQQNYRQVMARMEEASPSIGITAEEGAVIVEELEAIAPVIDQAYPDDIAIALRSAVTDRICFSRTTCRTRQSFLCWELCLRHRATRA